MSDDNLVPLDGLVKYVTDHLIEKTTRYSIVIDDLVVSGRRGCYSIGGTYRLVGRINNKNYELQNGPISFSVDKGVNNSTTIELPEAAMMLS